MAKSVENKHLKNRSGRWSYVRRVPEFAAKMDARAPVIREALGTDDLRQARYERDRRDRRNDRIWDAIRRLLEGRTSTEKFHSAQELEAALGLPPLPGHDLHDPHVREVLIDRILAGAAFCFGEGVRPTPQQLEEARPILETAAGRVMRPDLLMSELAAFYVDEVRAADLLRKSKTQCDNFARWPKLAASTFVEIVGDKPVVTINRADANKLRAHLQRKLAETNPKTGERYSSDAAGRCVGTLSRMLRAWADWHGTEDYRDPFAKITFKKSDRKRAPTPLEWIDSVLLHGEALQTLNREARGIFLILIETGLRLSEAANLRPEHIRLDAPVPHVRIEPVDDGTDVRELKTRAAVREVPLVGVGLEVAKAFPNGFPAYRGREAALSALLGKYLKDNELRPPTVGKLGPAHSLRHAWKDRLRDAGINEAMIDFLGGWRRSGVEYGTGFSLERKQEALLKIARPFDPALRKSLTAA